MIEHNVRKTPKTVVLSFSMTLQKNMVFDIGKETFAALDCIIQYILQLAQCLSMCVQI